MLSAFQDLRKIELHLHLEGAIPLPALWKLIRKYGGDPRVRAFEDLESMFEYTDFAHFIEIWGWKNRFLREYEDFSFIAEEVASDLRSQNVRYVEMFHSPGDYRRAGLGLTGITEAIRAGLARVPGIEVRLVTDLIRDHGPKNGMRQLEELKEIASELDVVGIGIGGSEHEFPPGPFAPVFERARMLGLRTTVHAGEACGPESVREALEALHPDRIGHAARAIEDPELVGQLAARRVPLELCVVSNVRTGVVGSFDRHPARAYYELGIPISINTDDPKLFGTSLAQEYGVLLEYLGFERDEVEQLIIDSVDCAWLPDDGKVALRRELGGDPP